MIARVFYQKMEKVGKGRIYRGFSAKKESKTSSTNLDKRAGV